MSKYLIPRFIERVLKKMIDKCTEKRQNLITAQLQTFLRPKQPSCQVIFCVDVWRKRDYVISNGCVSYGIFYLGS